MITTSETPPSRFRLLCQELTAVRRQYQDYREGCMLLAGELIEGLRVYLDSPDGFVSFYAISGSFAGRKVDGPSSALQLEDDTYWHFGIALDLYEENGQYPYHSIGFHLKLKQVEGAFELFVDESPAFLLRGPEQFESVYGYIFEFLQQRYRTSFREFLAGDGSRRFGF